MFFLAFSEYMNFILRDLLFNLVKWAVHDMIWQIHHFLINNKNMNRIFFSEFFENGKTELESIIIKRFLGMTFSFFTAPSHSHKCHSMPKLQKSPWNRGRSRQRKRKKWKHFSCCQSWIGWGEPQKSILNCRWIQGLLSKVVFVQSAFREKVQILGR